jgi:hypothetical protein
MLLSASPAPRQRWADPERSWSTPIVPGNDRPSQPRATHRHIRMQRSVSARWHDRLDQHAVERRGRCAAPPAFAQAAVSGARRPPSTMPARGGPSTRPSPSRSAASCSAPDRTGGRGVGRLRCTARRQRPPVALPRSDARFRSRRRWAPARAVFARLSCPRSDDCARGLCGPISRAPRSPPAPTSSTSPAGG